MHEFKYFSNMRCASEISADDKIDALCSRALPKIFPTTSRRSRIISTYAEICHYYRNSQRRVA